MRLAISIAAMLLLSLPASWSNAQPRKLEPDSFVRSYSFDQENEYATIIFESRSEEEDIIGVSRDASGYVMILGNGSGVEFRVEVPTRSLRTGITLRDQHLASDHWLDARRYPYIIFTGTSLERIGENGYRLFGTFYMHGYGLPLSVEAVVDEIPRTVSDTVGLPEGKWVSVRCTFTINLSEYGIEVPLIARDRVSDLWTVHVSLFARED
jgi:polyisoprenoid-binding protein YceI